MLNKCAVLVMYVTLRFTLEALLYLHVQLYKAVKVVVYEFFWIILCVLTTSYRNLFSFGKMRRFVIGVFQ